MRMKLLRSCNNGRICTVSVFLSLWLTWNFFLYCRSIYTGLSMKLSLFPVPVLLLMLCCEAGVKNTDSDARHYTYTGYRGTAESY